MPRRKPPQRNHSEEANAGSRPVDEEIELLLRHAALREDVRKARDQVLTALADRQHLYLALEDLAGERSGDREEAMFNLGFYHGQLEGGADSFAALWQKDEELRGLAAQVARLIVNARVEHRQAAAVLLEIAWSMLISQGLPSASRRA